MNKKILISLSIIGAVAAIAIGATVAYFNDVETSSGNILIAGTMDLKVDHKFASYNGNPCEEQCVVNESIDLMSGRNGGFENPDVTHSTKWDIFPSGTSGLTWTVEWRSDIPSSYGGWNRPDPALQELHEGVLGSAYEGDQYTELDSDWNGHNGGLNNEPASTKIYQDIPTTPGQKYQLKFAFSPRPNTGAEQNKLEVRWGGSVVATIGPVAGGGSINWTVYSYDVIASGNTTRLEFTDLGTAESMGTFLDAVKLHPYKCEYQIIGGTCTLWDLKDLGEGDYFWNFEDVKPGDYGTNIISLHAYNNDAYACLITNDIVDDENNLIDPEAEAGDVTPLKGELSQFIRVFAWEDTTQNNSYDSGEPIIAPVNTPLPQAIGRIELAASHTKYIGLAWCSGTQSLTGSQIICEGSTMGDIAQTDIMTASITAYAEQQRNNSDFVCPGVSEN